MTTLYRPGTPQSNGIFRFRCKDKEKNNMIHFFQYLFYYF